MPRSLKQARGRAIRLAQECRSSNSSTLPNTLPWASEEVLRPVPAPPPLASPWQPLRQAERKPRASALRRERWPRLLLHCRCQPQ